MSAASDLRTGRATATAWADGVHGAELAARAADALRANRVGSMTRAAPDLYPHQWSWDAGFVSVGIAHLDPRRACAELDHLFSGQWRTGMLPHIVFDPHEHSYFPGPDRWACRAVTDDAPAAPRTSGICQPPVHALAVERIVALADCAGPATSSAVRAWLPSAYRRLLAWHRYLTRERDPRGTGLITVYHSWEGGMDNSPRWDGPYSRVAVALDLPPYRRRDTRLVTDPGQRPTRLEYDRYLTGLDQLRRAGYDDARLRTTAGYRTTDVLFSAVFAAASGALARIARDLGAGEVAELEEHAARFRAGVAASVDAGLGLAVDTDLRTSAPLPAQTVAGFAPLLCGGLDPAAEEAMVDLFRSERWTGHPGLRHAVLPTTSPTSPDFRPRSYWRGPSWPVVNWLFVWLLEQRGRAEVVEPLRRASLDQLAEGSLAEYYEPFTGEPLGSARQSWTAAAALDLLPG
ncbi:glucosylglycerate hydrolase [Modestobacter marinus]|uniref:glucosylglycerate hydrolase n=1 Tax=Modestobacter marinus TaxID=477641 RepID=UPI001C96E1AC|nr:glycoside hydrolase 100 family protein [Modestobacter marinus]